MSTKVQIGNDSRMTYDFYASRPGDTGVIVDDETFERWRRVSSEWESMQRELSHLLEGNPHAELGEREPIPEVE